MTHLLQVWAVCTQPINTHAKIDLTHAKIVLNGNNLYRNKKVLTGYNTFYDWWRNIIYTILIYEPHST